MKKLLSTTFAIIALVTFTNVLKAQTGEKTAAKPVEWKEMSAFHEIMSKTFHPAEEGNLDPIKSRINEFVESAAAWQKSTAPAEYNDKPLVKENLVKLTMGAKQLQEMIAAKKDDKEITAKLSSLHDVFHTIVGECRKDSKAEHDHGSEPHTH